MRNAPLTAQILLFSIAVPVLAADTDGDGVVDGVDVCCHTPAGVTVDAQGRPKGDLDGDCDVDQSDFAIFQANMTGPITPCAPATEVCDGQDNNCNCLIDDGANASCPNVTNGTGACLQGGTCGFTCNTGFGNCDGNAVNGCEKDIRFDVNNCGTCGNVCPNRANSIKTCSDGVCGFQCTGSFQDCDQNPLNGCERTPPCP